MLAQAFAVSFVTYRRTAFDTGLTAMMNVFVPDVMFRFEAGEFATITVALVPEYGTVISPPVVLNWALTRCVDKIRSASRADVVNNRLDLCAWVLCSCV